MTWGVLQPSANTCSAACLKLVNQTLCEIAVFGWFREVWFGADDMAQASRARVMPLFAEDPLRIPDLSGAGPDAPSDETARGGSSPKIRVTS